MTHRQFLAWHEWLGMEWNRPDRHDHYAMRVAQSMTGGRLDDYAISFKIKEPPDLNKLTKRELKFYNECGEDLERWKKKAHKVEQLTTAAAIGAKHN